VLERVQNRYNEAEHTMCTSNADLMQLEADLAARLG
jgi:hypothetical protein